MFLSSVPFLLDLQRHFFVLQASAHSVAASFVVDTILVDFDQSAD